MPVSKVTVSAVVNEYRGLLAGQMPDDFKVYTSAGLLKRTLRVLCDVAGIETPQELLPTEEKTA